MSGVDDAITESPEFTGRGIVALATDPDVMRWTGRAVTTHGLAEAYGFADIDGWLPPDQPWQPPGSTHEKPGRPHRKEDVPVTALTHSGSIVISRTPEALYDMVADVTRMGEWSPICKACWWDEGTGPQVDAGPQVGSWFTGRNELPERTWETRSEVVAADRGREFAFIVGGTYVRWGYTFAPVDGGTEITESWELLPGGLAMFEERFAADAPAQIADRSDLAERGIAATLAAIKKVAEAA